MANKTEEFSDFLIGKLETKAKPQSTLAIVDFDNQDDASRNAGISAALSEIFTARFTKSEKFIVIEKKQ
ncbi:MAG TPA: hypothetical protein VF857_01705 [Spirochaetota bacterium]